MLLHEVIKVSNGMPFKLPNMADYLYVKTNGVPQEDFLYWAHNNKLCALITVTALTSDKWELLINGSVDPLFSNNVIPFKSKK